MYLGKPKGSYKGIFHLSLKHWWFSYKNEYTYYWIYPPPWEDIHSIPCPWETSQEIHGNALPWPKGVGHGVYNPNIWFHGLLILQSVHPRNIHCNMLGQYTTLQMSWCPFFTKVTSNFGSARFPCWLDLISFFSNAKLPQLVEQSVLNVEIWFFSFLVTFTATMLLIQGWKINIEGVPSIYNP